MGVLKSRGEGLKIEKITFFAETEWAHLDPSPLKDRSISDPPQNHGEGGLPKKGFFAQVESYFWILNFLDKKNAKREILVSASENHGGGGSEMITLKLNYNKENSFSGIEV